MTRLPSTDAGKVRIIGGCWRGTRLAVANVPGLRPSSDRVRETLFNWLAPMLPGARVADLFAGSGALGLEAVSRGAAHAVLVERDTQLVASLNVTVSRLSAQACIAVAQEDALAWLSRQPEEAFDLAFADPPFSTDVWPQLLPLLLTKLAPGGWLYVESAREQTPAMAAAQWCLHREGATRDVRFALYRRPFKDGADTLPGDLFAAVPE